jgi:adenosylmethionine-8-amino-7-oxononanoate aminotransferase
MSEWSRAPLLMAKADGVHFWDVDGVVLIFRSCAKRAGKHYWDALSGIYTTSVGHNNARVKDAIRTQLDVLHFSPPMHGSNPIAVRLADLLRQYVLLSCRY